MQTRESKTQTKEVNGESRTRTLALEDKGAHHSRQPKEVNGESRTRALALEEKRTHRYNY